MSSQDKNAQLARLQEQLRVIIAERQRLELEIKETERVQKEIQALPEGTELYKSTGPVLYKSTTQEVLQGLEKYKAELNERLELYKTQESALRTEIERLRKSVMIQPKFGSEETQG
ncbi:hypothetical protein B9Q13_05050 [Candidatus Marsarchaeota G2 archaeon ECH_B_SAG-G16]|jgi:prefoldin beta subunit|uniref:Prefoldin subunit beta n=4 Tax=Candidatus Marsarchaeota TaxID=1978152 RepID=A0A2R6AK51_9ARCH|nr:MAG: hypothetical protein B9Q01_00340 [Candidatus Marsarchaeota G1 archaeon OSP_D]PSN86723.1 MAG: hypothetical protein B9Q02_00695 [Candidatus Marsarchaeota G1 archaeon BE_D]PSN89700.1 MAG: hypothetical protein B9Q00_00350 [Candidatus Marsarchaeota G1 archaeon OSP_C]PSO04255.1 MAG: hypothetical protein B9Q13_05050 [Candidatus Marsarchaeota G2 archaeon ECH_B_SAG-G16]